MRRWLIFSTLWLLAVAAATTFHVPWQRPHPTDPDLSIHLGYAPLWSHRFAAIPAAHPDGFHVTLAFFLALLLPATLAADNLIARSLGARLALRGSNGRAAEEPSPMPMKEGLRVDAEVKVLPFPSSTKSQGATAKSGPLTSALSHPAPSNREVR